MGWTENQWIGYIVKIYSLSNNISIKFYNISKYKFDFINLHM
jgi:hypothetical protein